ncbi:MAG: transcription-repair coupling factor, partial [Fimbriimonas sp.]
MRLDQWVRLLPQITGLAEAFEPIERPTEWRSIAYEARPVLVAAAYLQSPRKTLIVTANYERALAWQAKLQLCGVPHDAIRQLPSGISALFEDSAPEHIALSDRLGALKQLADDAPSITIATPQSVLERTIPRDVLVDSYFEIKVGESLDIEKLQRHLAALGYEKQEPVRLPGQFSRRGGILDVFPTGRDLPIRIELFGDDVESLRQFDPNTQRSVGKVPALSLSPSRETLFGENVDYIRDMILDSVEREAAGLPEDVAKQLEETIGSDLQALSNKVYFDRLDLYRPLLHPDSGCAADLLGEDGILLLDEPLEIATIGERGEEELGLALEARTKRGEILQCAAHDFMLPPEHLGYTQRRLALTAMNDVPRWAKGENAIEVQALSLEPYRGRPEALTTTLKTWQDNGFKVLFGTDQPNRATAMLNQIEVFPTQEMTDGPGYVLASGNLGGGFAMPEAKIAVLSDAELFGVARLKLPQKRFMEGAPIATVLDLRPGDYVVHINFGIGIFRGLAKRVIEGVEREFLYIEYQAPDKLFVPADQLDRIQKYLNPGDDHPKLNRLTGTEWQRTLGKAREDAKEFARELVKLYAARKAVQRRPYGPDTPWQHEMESTFPWVETPSQMQAIVDAKIDLQADFPMDRLVCGDVGFGKTEVAIRAAFKVVQSGRQVAVLCPTTILSEQHCRNFEERLGPFGTQLGILNRYRTAAEKKQVLADVKSGKIEILIGTHSLLGTGLEFKDLGLVVIDEEQKFGVKQKEMLKQLRTEVDVLTLSATPIPRTLSMALMDIRQMSLINDPPPGRLPIRTFLRGYSGEVVREAILRELARGGQVFYVYNRVESIYHVAEKLRKLVPLARIGVGHGQMSEKELEPVMIGFIKGEIDILLSTTIIENGIDISNANTLIVENADRLGLSQLYQLRGRVGRSDRQAYAYLLYQENKSLTENAMARLQALQEFSTLGSGYSLAFRDLQIRGAGEMLGSKQHGAMASVGYELYTQLIHEAVEVLKSSVDGMPSAADLEKDVLSALEPLPAFELPVVALIPDGYLKDHAQRLYYYQRMMSARELKTLGEVQAEVEDRYGKAPKEVSAAFTILALRITGREVGIEKLDGKGGRLSVVFKDKQSIPPRAFSILGKKNRECYVNRDSFVWPYTGDPMAATERMMREFTAALKQVEQERAS